jgi:hypothetical protein
MLKIIWAVMLLLLTSSIYGGDEYNKDITVLNQSRSDKVKQVFYKLMNYYEEEDENGFFSLVSEDRFLQDYMLFREAIEKDFRDYEILSFDYWIDKITDDGVKRYMYVKWEKRYEISNSTTEKTKLGYSRFLFDEINGEYKLIEVAGNTLWGESLEEWKEEVPQIPGQESEEEPDTTTQSALPDLIIINECVTSGQFKIKNIGQGSTTNGEIQYRIFSNGDTFDETYSGDLAPGESSSGLNCNGAEVYGGVITIDPDNLIEESNENNNELSL